MVAANPIDWKMMEGGFGPALPFTPGEDLSGVVEEVGEGVTAFKSGDAVLGMLGMDRPGAFASYVTAPADWLAAKPDALSFETAAAIPMGALTAWIALFDIGDLSPGQRVLIHAGAGAVGSMAIQLAKWRGAWVAATASGAGLDYVRSIGADLVIDHRTERFEERIAQEGRVNLVVDTLAGESRDRSWAALRDGGAMVSTLGETKPPASAGNLRGSRGFAATPDGRRMTEIASLAASGGLRPQIGRIFLIDQVAEAMELVKSGGTGGKVLLNVSPRKTHRSSLPTEACLED